MNSSKSSTTDNPDRLLGAISDNDLRRWQLTGARALVEILNRASKAKLKPIEWRLLTTTRVAGYIHATDYGNVQESVLDAFGAWCQLLTLTADDVVKKSGGGIYVVGHHGNWRPKPNQTGARVSVTAQTFQL